jgi:hypothetical protein
MQRIRLSQMDTGARLWMLKKVKKEYWRVCKVCDPDELLQDGFMLYAMVLDRYPTAVKAKHRMSLFMRIFSNHIHRMARNQSNRPEAFLACELSAPDGEPIIELDCLDNETSTLAAKIANAPKPVQDVLALYTTEEGLRKLRSAYRLRKDGTRETLNERLCRLVGLDPSTGIDLPLLIKACLS